MHRRIMNEFFRHLPYSLVCSVVEMQLNSTFDHEEYQLKPKHRVLSQHIMVNDTLPNRILSGTVKIKSDIDYFTENGVVFKGKVNTFFLFPKEFFSKKNKKKTFFLLNKNL